MLNEDKAAQHYLIVQRTQVTIEPIVNESLVSKFSPRQKKSFCARNLLIAK